MRNSAPYPQVSGIGRRQFLKSAAAGAFAVATGTGQSFAENPAPKRGGHFRFGTGSGATTDSLDPTLYLNSFMNILGHSHHSYLAEVDSTGKLVGELAETWDASKDAKTWRFNLRKGVEFHNGKTFDANDVLATINFHLDEKSKSAARESLLAIQEIKSDGSHTVVVELKEGSADFPYLFDHYQLAMLPAKDGKVDTSGVGAGGYVLESFDPGVRAVSKRFSNYWKTNAAWFDSFEILSLQDPTARMNALLAGEIGAMDNCDLKSIDLLKSNEGLEVVSIGGTKFYQFNIMVDVPPFDNQDVRLALKYAIDRQQLLDTLLQGYGELGNDHPIASSNRFFAKTLPQRKYDPDKAKFHLNKAGLSELKVSLSAADAAFTGAVDAGLLYQQNAAKAGITIDVVREPSDSYWDNVWMKKSFYATYWGGRPTADWMFTQAFAAEAAWNETHWKSPRFNELLLAARSELDDAKRLEMYTEMQSLCSDDGGAIVPVFANYVNAISNKIGHGKIGTSWDMDGFRCAERWWSTET